MTKLKKQKGVAIIMAILLMSLVMFMAIYFLSFSLTENNISHSQAWGVKTYYLAEAGIAEMVWRLKNDETYKTSFETDPGWNENFVRNDPFGPGSGSYDVTVSNSDLARGEIVAIGSIDISGATSQRIVKTYVYKALNSSSTADIASSSVLTDNQADISLSRVNIINGSVHSNNDINVNGISTVNVDEDVRAVNEFDKSLLSTVNVGGNIMDNVSYPPPPTSIPMPPVSFDEPTDPNSLKNQATRIFTEAEFTAYINTTTNPLTINYPITYVTGDVVFEGDPDIILNGLLVADGSITIGMVRWIFFVPYCKDNEYTSFTINGSPGNPTGLISKDDINFELCTSGTDVEGVLYAADEIMVMDFADNVDMEGSVIARNLNIISIWQPIDIIFNDTIFSDTLEETEFSPVITVEHWEEEY